MLELGPVSPRSAGFLVFMLVASGLLEPTGRERITVSGIPNPERLLADPSVREPHDDGQEAAARELSARQDEIAGLGDYAVLGVEPGASETEVTAAFEALAPLWHPDRFRSYADPALLRLAGRVFDRHVLAFYRILNPAQKPESSSEIEVRRAMLTAAEPEAKAPAPTEADMPGLQTAVVLDDDPDSSRTLAEILFSLGFAPEVAPGRVALRRILSTPGRRLALALVDVDLLMGLDASNLELLAESCRSSGAPCIGVFSRATESRDQLFFTKFGIQNLVEKHAPSDEIRHRLAAFVGRDR